MRLLRLGFIFYSSLCFGQFDILITGGKVVDGTGSGWYYADVGVTGDHIAAIGPLSNATAKTRLDAKGLVVSPGFIDIHSHARRGITLVPSAENLIRQGVTMVLEGNDGDSPLPVGAYLDNLSKKPIGINFGVFAGQGSIRANVMGLVNRPASPEELEKMCGLMKRAMLDGAFGMSTGLFYVPGNFTPPDEVIEVAKVAAKYGGMHISHMRDEAANILEAVKETIRIGEVAGMPTQVSHHKIIGRTNWGQSKETLKLVEEARARGVDVTIDQYPYTASSTGTGALFPQWALEGGNKSLIERMDAPEQRARIRATIVTKILDDRGGGDAKNVVLAGCSFDKSLAGKSLADLAIAQGKQPTPENAADIAMDLQRKGGCSAVYHAISEDDVERIMRYPFTMIASDGGVQVFGEAAPHPRSYGTFARVLGVYVRERHVLTLEDAVRRMSSLPATRLKLFDRGLIRPGMKADIAVFDAGTVIDKSEFAKPHQYAEGVRHVLVNGKAVMADGKMTGELSGAVLRGPGYSH